MQARCCTNTETTGEKGYLRDMRGRRRTRRGIGKVLSRCGYPCWAFHTPTKKKNREAKPEHCHTGHWGVTSGKTPRDFLKKHKIPVFFLKHGVEEIGETEQPRRRREAQHRSSGQDSDVHLHLKDKRQRKRAVWKKPSSLCLCQSVLYSFLWPEAMLLTLDNR